MNGTRFLILALMPLLICGATEDPLLIAPEPLLLTGQRFLALNTAYEDYVARHKQADFSKLTISLLSQKDAKGVITAYDVVIGYWRQTEIGQDGKVKIIGGYDYDSKHGDSLGYVVDATTSKIIEVNHRP